MTGRVKNKSDYWEQSRSPSASLLFILPFLLVYEVGMLTRSNWGSVRNGADVWIRQALLQSGLSYEWLLPLLVPVILLAWHLFQKEGSWSIKYETLSGMFAESVLYAMLMIVVGQLTFRAFPASLAQAATPTSARVLTFLGAGIYEELLFRLLLLPVIYWALRGLRTPHRWAIVSSVLLSSFLFATAHYLDGTASLFSPYSFAAALHRVQADATLWYSYSFRYLAGVLFSLLFWLRGFGITVGTHILYDLIVGIMLSGIG